MTTRLDLTVAFERFAARFRELLEQRDAAHPIYAAPMDRVWVKAPPIEPEGSFAGVPLAALARVVHEQIQLTPVSFTKAWDQAVARAVFNGRLVKDPRLVVAALSRAMSTESLRAAPDVSTLGILNQALKIASWQFGRYLNNGAFVGLDRGDKLRLTLSKERLEGATLIRRFASEAENLFLPLQVPVGSPRSSTAEVGALARRLFDYLPEHDAQIEMLIGTAVHCGDIEIQHQLAKVFDIQRVRGPADEGEFVKAIKLTYEADERPRQQFAELLAPLVKSWSHPFFTNQQSKYAQADRRRDRLDILALQRQLVPRPEVEPKRDLQREEAERLAHLVQSIR